MLPATPRNPDKYRAASLRRGGDISVMTFVMTQDERDAKIRTQLPVVVEVEAGDEIRTRELNCTFFRLRLRQTCEDCMTLRVIQWGTGNEPRKQISINNV